MTQFPPPVSMLRLFLGGGVDGWRMDGQRLGGFDNDPRAEKKMGWVRWMGRRDGWAEIEISVGSFV